MEFLAALSLSKTYTTTIKLFTNDPKLWVEALVGKSYLERAKADNWIGRYERIMAGTNSFINYLRDKKDKGIGKGKRPG
jgi:hypothetical protein